MNSKLKLLSLLFLVTATSLINLNAQIQENYFADFSVKEGGNVNTSIRYENTIIIGGRTFDKARYNPNIICFDTLGNKVWETITNDTTTYKEGYSIVSHIVLGIDSFIYTSYTDSRTITELWKVNPKNGDIIWKKTIPTPYSSAPIDFLIDYDSTSLIYTYKTGFNRFKYDYKIAKVKKLDGSIISDKVLEYVFWHLPSYFVSIDKNKDLYYSIGDTITKLDGIDTSNVLWKKSYSSEKIDDFSKGIFDSSSNFFVFGKLDVTHGRGVLLKINPNNGNLISSHISYQSRNVRVSDVKIKKNYIYISWRHIYVGGGTNYFWTTKYDIINDVIVWDRAHSFPYKGGQAALSIDLDDADDLYMTGYVAAHNYGPGTWIATKFDGIKGDTIYYKIIANDVTRVDERSMGIGAHIINNKPYFVGILQTTPQKYVNKTAITVVGLDPIGGKLNFKKDHFGTYQYISSTVNIREAFNKKVLVVKQQGDKILLEMYDSVKKRLWSTSISRQFKFLVAGNTFISKTSRNIFISAYSAQDGYYNNFISPHAIPDSLHVFQLDSNGKQVRFFSFRANDFRTRPLNVFTHDSDVYFFYSRLGNLYYRRLTENNPYEHRTSTDIENYYKRINIIHDLDSNYFLALDKRQMLKIDKKTMSSSLYMNYGNLKTEINNYLTIVDDSLMIIGGQTSDKYDHIFLINYKAKTTLWTKELSQTKNSEVNKVIVSPDKRFAYPISNSSNNIVVRKVSLATGNIIWSYSYNSVRNFDDQALDIAYDEVSDHIVITGFEGKLGGTKVIFILLDTLGNTITKYSRDGDFGGINAGVCAYVWKDGTKWVGGNLNKQPYGLAGFIWGIEKCFTDSSSITVNTCNNYNSPSGKYTWNTTGMYYDTVTNGSGCDSIIKIDLTINNSTAATISETSCNTFLSPSGKYLWNTTGTYNDTITNTTGCDSIITVNLTISTFSTSTINETVCDDYTSPSGKHVWLTSGTYKDTILTQNGCDSIITINLTIRTLNTAVTNTNNTLSASLSGATYQWLNCNGNTPIAGATSQSYTPTANGSYSVIITDNTCTDTSSCIAVTNVSVNKVNTSIDELVSISPNPSSGIYSITFKKEFNPIQIELYDAIGKLIYSSQTIKGSGYYELDLSARKNGIYYIQFNEDGNYLGRKKLIKF